MDPSSCGGVEIHGTQIRAHGLGKINQSSYPVLRVSISILLRRNYKPVLIWNTSVTNSEWLEAWLHS